MAAPAEKTIRDLSGKWQMNKALSGDTDAILVLQGIGWLTRKAIGIATVTLHIKEYTGDDGALHIDIDQTATGGLKGTTELRTLVWEEAKHVDGVFGPVVGKSRLIKLHEIGDEAFDDEAREFLKRDWENPEGDFVESHARSETNGWTAVQIWGFQVVDGVRRYSRNVVVQKGSEKKMAKLIYDWIA